MAGKSKNNGSGLLLLAGLGVGTFLLFNNKAADAQVAADSNPGPAQDEDIPAAPKIVAVNTASTESPLPTGIVSDEDGMMPAGGSGQSMPSSNATSAWNDDEDNEPASTGQQVPKLVSTKLTEKEKAVIQKGVLSDELAIKRPDLYKAIYVKKHGQKGKSKLALKAADSIIQKIKSKNHGKLKPAPAPAKKRKVALRLNTKIAMKPGAVKHPVQPAKPAAKPLVLVKRPAPAAKKPTGKAHPARPKVATKWPVRPVTRNPVPAKKSVRH